MQEIFTLVVEGGNEERPQSRNSSDTTENVSRTVGEEEKLAFY